jgi:HTH-type transcriptional regulator, sugar sensing transcriptional regulator
MDKSLQSTLSLLGLTPKETKFYLSSFKLGPSSVNEIARDAKLERSTAYLIFQDLLDKGFIQEDHKSYGKKIFAVEPKDLIRMLGSKQRQLRRLELELEENLPELQALYQASEIRPKVRVFEGKSGLLNVWQDILSSKSEILLWTNQETETSIFPEEFHKRFIDERIKKNLPIKVLAVSNKKAEGLQKTDSKELRETKILPSGVNFSAETYIYNNKIAILDYKKDIIGVIIESEPMSNSHRAIFEMTWNSN